MPFDLNDLFHAVTGVFEDALHGLAGCFRKHLAQVVQLSTARQTKQTEQERIKRFVSRLERETEFFGGGGTHGMSLSMVVS